MKVKIVTLARKIIVLIVGSIVLVVGIILIPLPGPGILVSMFALFILSTEFDWADKHFQRAKAKTRKIYEDSKERADSIANKSDSENPS